MMRDKNSIPFPDKEIVEREIKAIVAKGLSKPEPFHQLLHNLYKQIGIRYLMRDMKEIMIAVWMMVIVMFAVLEIGKYGVDTSSNLYGMIMLISPILYGALSLLPYLNSKSNSTFEVEMTCKYNLNQIAAFRMLVFSVFCFLLNTGWVLVMAVSFTSVQFVQALMISTTSLLLFSLLILYVFTTVKKLMTKAIIITGWFGLQSLLIMIDSTAYHQLLVSVPWYLYGFVICLSGYLYVKKIKKFILQIKRRGAYIYATD